jgi:hypothetical protein
LILSDPYRALAVSSEAVLEFGGQSVFVVNDGNSVERRPVKLVWDNGP